MRLFLLELCISISAQMPKLNLATRPMEKQLLTWFQAMAMIIGGKEVVLIKGI